jgi:PEP-CTERM motif
MKLLFARVAAPLLLSLAVPAAHATSAATASLSFRAVASSGFNWLSTPPSQADSSATAAAMTGFELSAGVFSPVYAALQSDVDVEFGTAVPTSAAAATSSNVVSGAATTALLGLYGLTANAVVPTQGKADATSFASSWFSLAPGASVTFLGSIALGASGFNPSLPANYSTNDFYSFASGLLAVGSDQVARELGGPAATSGVGGYSLGDAGSVSLTFTNSTNALLTTYLESGVTVYTASAVPEPGTYALLLAGLSALGWVARRRRGDHSKG